jgi:hypothetical protein
VLPVEHVAVGAAAFATAKVAVLDRRAPFLTYPTAGVLFAIFGAGALNLTVVRAVDTGTGEELVTYTFTETWALLLGAAGALVMFSLLVLEAVGELPDPRVRHGVESRPGMDVGGRGGGSGNGRGRGRSSDAARSTGGRASEDDTTL